MVISCPHCGETLATRDLTLKQQRLISAIASGKYPTQRQAAEAAGMHQVSASQALSKPYVSVALNNQIEKQTDKASAAHERAERLLSKSLGVLESQMAVAHPDPALAGSVAKLASELQLQQLKIREMMGDDAGPQQTADARAQWSRSIRIASRYARLARSATPEQIAERVERWMLRRR